MTADPGPLLAIAGELDRRAAVLRLRAALVGASPQRTRWSSTGARAWADAVAQISAALLQTARCTERAAATLRARAVAIGR